MAPRVALKERRYCDAFNDTSKAIVWYSLRNATWTVIVLVDDHKMRLFCFGNSINYIFYLFISLYKLIINYYIILHA